MDFPNACVLNIMSVCLVEQIMATQLTEILIKTNQPENSVTIQVEIFIPLGIVASMKGYFIRSIFHNY